MRSLSKAAEQKLIGAIEQAAAYVNDGMEPNAAIVKSASAANIPAGHINLMVHAYNTGRTNKQREQGENTYEKAADFRLANADVVLGQLYPENVKTSAEIIREQVVSTEYAVSPAGFLARRRAEMEKAAAAQIALPAKTYTPAPRDPDGEVRRAYSMKVAAQRQAEELRRQASAAYTKAAASLDELAQYFKVPGNMSFTDAVAQVGMRFGQEGVSVLQKVAGVYPQLEKQAATKLEHYGHDRVYDLVENVLHAVGGYVDAQKKVPAVKTAADNGKKELPVFLTGSILHNPADEPLTLKEAAGAGAGAGGGPSNKGGGPSNKDSFSDTLNRYSDGARKATAKTFNFALNGLGKNSPEQNVLSNSTAATKSIGEAIGVGAAPSAGNMAKSVLGLDKDPDKMQLNEYMNITSPDHETALKNIRAQATLHDMLMNDPVISGYEPREVAVAFNDVAQAAPNVVDSPAVLQAVLRKRLEAGQFADFDVKQLLEMDKLKADRDKTMLQLRQLEQGLVYNPAGSAAN